MRFQSITKQASLSKLVEAQIELAIRSRKYAGGAKLPSEHELCEQFGVSRTAIREALRMLSARGLIHGERGRGNFVREVTSDIVTTPMNLYLHMSDEDQGVLDIVRARQMVEPSIAAWAAQHRTDDDVLKLEKEVNDLVQCEGDENTLSELDIRFHLDIARSTHNPIIPLLLDPLHRLLPTINIVVYANVKEAKRVAVAGHEDILNAIRERNPDRAFRAMRQHLEMAYEHTKRSMTAEHGAIGTINKEEKP